VLLLIDCLVSSALPSTYFASSSSTSTNTRTTITHGPFPRQHMCSCGGKPNQFDRRFRSCTWLDGTCIATHTKDSQRWQTWK
jgi:hypothetical protein